MYSAGMWIASSPGIYPVSYTHLDVYNRQVQDAVVRNYEIIGEAAKNVSEEFRVQHPEIDWRGMAGFRDVLIHQYFGIDLINVWNISQNQAEKVLKQITALPEYGIAKANLSDKV